MVRSGCSSSLLRLLLLVVVIIGGVSSSFHLGPSSTLSSRQKAILLKKVTKKCRTTSLTTTTTTTATTLRGGGNSDNNNNNNDLKDYSSEASALFGNIRIPAALFSGASAGAAFAMPISVSAAGSEGLKVGLIKRLYSFLMIGALSSEILAVVVSTVSVASLAMMHKECHNDDDDEPTKPTKNIIKTKTLSEFIIKNNYELSWISSRFHFLSGVLCFVMALGIRAWIVIVCPIFAKAALGLISSATMLCIAFIQDMGIFDTNSDDNKQSSNNKLGTILNLPLKYLQLFVSKAKKNPYFAIALGLYLLTFGYVTYMIPHIWNYLK